MARKKIDAETKQFLRQVLISFVGLPVLTTASIVTAGKIASTDYASDRQIEKIAEGLDCDLTVMKTNGSFDKFLKLSHNNGDPIYVSFNGEYPEESKQAAINSLDYVFEIVGGINPNYSEYEIVDSSHAKELKDKNKSVIEYTTKPEFTGEEESFNGYADRFSLMKDPMHFFAGKWTMPGANIVTREVMEEELNIDYVFTHELLHVFGFGDVYTYSTKSHEADTRKFCGNTIMNVEASKGEKSTLITPNDYACLMAAYAEPMNKKERQDYIEKCKVQLEKYKDYYYSKLVEDAKNIANNSKTKKISGDYETHFDFLYDVTDEDEELCNKLSVSCSGDKYSLVLVDNDGKCIDTAEGKARLIDGCYVLEDVNLKNDYHYIYDNYDGYVTDLVLIGSDYRDILYDAGKNKIEWGDEKQKMQNVEQER